MTPDTSERELRELDAFCALKVMRFTRMTKRVKLHAAEGRTLYSDGAIYKWLDDYGAHSECWSPTENGGQALQVIRRCLEKRRVKIQRHINGEIEVHNSTFYARAETLELAICLFARNLFSQREG